ncbi:cobalamin-binding protein [Roseimaritima sediminicola]|uniref:cobalamin-binding protein n=1 Tax=Roseimaritima sediminicola TaxID=2662066 RepID=UPI001298311D|nr:cobalamin-binding protein [Roseimaritima sediminicola]
MRIVSLLPSATEIVCALGLRSQLVGVTHECDFPAGIESLPAVTRSWIPPAATSREIDALVRERLKSESALYSLDMPTLQRLSPDLIVTQTLCDVCAVAEREVREAVSRLPGSPRVVNLEPTRLADVFEGIAAVAAAAGVEDRSREVVAELEARVERVVQRARRVEPAERPSVLLLEWIDPPFSAGHWSPELVEKAGGRELLGVPGERSRAIEWERIVELDPEILVIACCGFDEPRMRQDLPILEAKPGWESLRCVRNQRVHIVDGSAYFNRPGPRLVDSLEILSNLIT